MLSARSAAGIGALIIFLASVFLYSPTADYGFVGFDDWQYVQGNPAVTRGLILDGVAEAFTRPLNNLWIPLTSLSYVHDGVLFGPSPVGFHLEEIALHSVAAALLLLTLHAYTGRLYPSFAAAALWALHPLRVESVAWISDRKDVLALVLLLVSLLCYKRLARSRRRFWFGATMCSLAAGLMAKPSLTTAPVLFLLLDYWPLGRFAGDGAAGQRGRRETFYALLREKIPFLVLAAVFVIVATVTIGSPHDPSENAPGALTSLCRSVCSPWIYLRQTFWPVDLGPRFAPGTPGSPATMFAIASAAILLSVTALLAVRRRFPYLLIGWLWYLVALLPTSGIVPTGMQWLADRYTYIPHIGIAVMLSWGLRDLTAGLRRRALVNAAALSATCIVLALLSLHQMRIWRDSVSLFTRAVVLSPHDPIALNDLGGAYGDIGDFEQALAFFTRASAEAPRSVRSRFNMGLALEGLGRLDDARVAYENALAVAPGDATTHLYLGRLLLRRDRTAEAIDHLQAALRLGNLETPELAAIARESIDAANAMLGSAHAPPGAPLR